MFVAIILVLVAISLLLFYASYSISLGIYVKSICCNPKNNDSVALTFDDGVDDKMTPKVLKILKKHGAKATFFVVGEKAVNHPDIVKMIVEQGHSIGNHSYGHKWYFPLKTSQMDYHEINTCTEILEQISGRKIIMFRPPFGVTNPMIARAVKRAGLISVGWSIRSLDTLGHPIERVTKRVSRQLKAGKVILLHDNRDKADILTERILQEIELNGLKTVTIEELFNLK